jgi:HEAT repeat protein
MGRGAAPAADALVAALDDMDPLLRSAAARALGAIGPDASKGQQKLVDLLTTGDPISQATAASALANISPGSATVAEAMLKRLDGDARVASVCLDSLRKMSIETVGQALAHLLAADPQLPVGHYLHRLILELPPDVLRKALPGLITLLTRDDVKGRPEIADKLRQAGDPTPACLPALMAILRSEPPDHTQTEELWRMARPDGRVRHYAVWATGRLGPAAKEAIPSLIRKDPKGAQVVDIDETQALGLIGPAAASTVPVILRSYVEGRWDWGSDGWTAAKTALLRMGEAGAPYLVEALNTEPLHPVYGNASSFAADVLEAMGPQAAAALVDGLKTTNSSHRVAVCRLLAKCGAAGAPATERLMAFIHSEDSELREAAIMALAGIGPKAAEATDALVAVLPSYSAQQALIAIGTPAAKPVIQAFHSGDARVKYAAIDVLVAIGPKSPDIVPTLMQAAKDGDLSAIGALGRLGQAAEPAVEVLLDKLNNGSGNEPRVACGALAMMKLGGDRVIPVLLEHLVTDPPQGEDVIEGNVTTFRPPARTWNEIDVKEALRAYAGVQPAPIMDALRKAQKLPPSDKNRRRLVENLASTVDAMDPLPDDAVPLLLQLLRENSESAMRTLEKMGPVVLPHVAPLIERGDPVISADQLRRIAFGLEVHSAEVTCEDLMILHGLQEHRDPAVRRLAGAIWTREYERYRPAWLVKLQDGLTADDEKVRLFAANELARMKRTNLDVYNPDVERALREAAELPGPVGEIVKAAMTRPAGEDPSDPFFPSTSAEISESGRELDRRLEESAPLPEQQIARWNELLTVGSGDERSRALDEIEETGKAAAGTAKAVARVMLAGDDFDWIDARDALQAMGPSASDAMAVLVEGIKNSRLDVGIRRSCVNVIESIGPAAADAVPILIGLLESRDEYLPVAAADALGAMGPAARAAGAQLHKIASDERSDYDLREAARKAAQAVAPALRPTAQDVATALLRHDRAAYDQAICRLQKIDPALKTESQAVAAALETITPKQIDWTDAGRRALVILVKRLGYLEPDAQGTAAMVRAAVFIPYEAKEQLAAVSIPQEVVPYLLDVARSEDYQRSDSVVFAQECLVRAGKSAVPNLLPLLDGDEYQRRFAMQALAGMGPDAAPSLGKILPLLDSEDDTLPHLALSVLADMGPAAAPAAPKLLAILRTSRTGGEAVLAARALGNMGAAGKDAVPDLMQLMIDYQVRQAHEEAILALARLRPCIKAAGGPLMPQLGRDLVELCRNSAPYPYCLEAMECIQQLGPEASFLEPELLELATIEGNAFTSPDEAKAYAVFRQATKKALTQILGREPNLPSQSDGHEERDAGQHNRLP